MPLLDSPPMKRLDIQGLRALAVLTVVADHAGLGAFAGGYVGVDVFFVVSGFLITGLLVRETEVRGRVRLLDFYARRARRILPAATVVLVATLAFSALFLGYLRVQRVAADVGWSAAFLANVRFADLGTDYFAEGLPPSPVQHYWSLAVEEQFYLVWPVLLLALVALSRRGRRGDVDADGTPVRVAPRWGAVAAFLGLLCAVSFVWSVQLVGDDRTAAYFSSPARAWELGVGALLALAGMRVARLPHALRGALAAGGLVAIAVAVLAYDDATPFPGYAALLPVLGTAALLAAGTGSEPVGPARVLTWRPLTWIGDLSYSWYLWHWPVLVLWEARHPGQVGWLETTALVALSLGLAVATYHLVENPVRHQRWLGARTGRGLVLWPAALAVTVVAILGAQAVSERRLDSRLSANEQYLALRDDDVAVRDQLRASLKAADVGAPVAYPLTDLDQIDDLRDDRWHLRYRCHAAKTASSVRICPVGDPEADRDMVVIGDSHVGQWLPALDDIGRQRGYRVVPLVKLGCTPFDVPVKWDDLPYTECTTFRTWVRDRVAELDPALVVVGSRGLQRNITVPEAEREAAWRAGAVTTLQGLAPHAGRLVVLADVPALGTDPVECVTDPRATMTRCTTTADPRVLTANRLTADAAREVGATFVEVDRLACLDRRCPAVAGGRMVYANADHLSVAWARRVAVELDDRLVEAGVLGRTRRGSLVDRAG